MLGYSTN